MWGINLGDNAQFVYSVFGLQYQGDDLVEPQRSLAENFHKLIHGHAASAEQLSQDGPGDRRSIIWLAYWPSKEAFASWWTSPATADFWCSLPDDAGMWREIMAVPGRRTQFGSNSTATNGMSSVAELVPYKEHSGYWGCYRDRIREATPQERLQTPLKEFPQRKEFSGNSIRLGRTQVVKFPDNLCFVVEGQDHSRITDEEKAHWFDKFDGLVTTWMDHLDSAGASGGILDAKLCYSKSSGTYRSAEPPALNYNRKVQLFYFLDFRCMEKIGRANKGHVKLRESFMQSYCPAGPMEKGLLTLWVETSVLKGNEMEAEYIGCVEGTGFMAYEGSEALEYGNSVNA